MPNLADINSLAEKAHQDGKAFKSIVDFFDSALMGGAGVVIGHSQSNPTGSDQPTVHIGWGGIESLHTSRICRVAFYGNVAEDIGSLACVVDVRGWRVGQSVNRPLNIVPLVIVSAKGRREPGHGIDEL